MSEPTVYEGEPTSAHDNFILDWSLELRKKSVDRQFDLLQRLVTLNSTLLGGAVVFLKDDVAHPVFRWLALISFLVSLAISFFASFPRLHHLPETDPVEAGQVIERTLDSRHWYASWAAIVLWAGLALAAVGALIGVH